MPSAAVWPSSLSSTALHIAHWALASRVTRRTSSMMKSTFFKIGNKVKSLNIQLLQLLPHIAIKGK